MAYVAGTASLVYIMGFLGGVGVPKRIGDGEAGPVWSAFLVNTALIGAFGLHHSNNARASFKRWWTQATPTDHRIGRPYDS